MDKFAQLSFTLKSDELIYCVCAVIKGYMNSYPLQSWKTASDMVLLDHSGTPIK